MTYSSEIVSCMLHMLFLILKTTLPEKYYYPCFADKGFEAKRSQCKCWRPVRVLSPQLLYLLIHLLLILSYCCHSRCHSGRSSTISKYFSSNSAHSSTPTPTPRSSQQRMCNPGLEGFNEDLWALSGIFLPQGPLSCARPGTGSPPARLTPATHRTRQSFWLDSHPSWGFLLLSFKKIFFPVLMRHNWHITLCKFKAYDTMIRYPHVFWHDYHNQVS